MKSTSLLVIALMFTLSSQGFANENLSPVRGFITELAMASSPKALAHLKSGISNPKKVGWKTKDEALVKKVLAELKIQKAQITFKDNYFHINVAGIKIQITIVDFISRTVSINGQHYIFNEDKSLREHIDALSITLKKKTTFNNPFIEDAHAFLPLLFIIPAIIAGSTATVVLDGLMSQAVNDMKNMDEKTMAKVEELKKKYNERANACESDLENAKSSNSKGHIEGLSSVRALGQLHKTLNTELYNTWFNGKSQINYDELSCTQTAQENEIASGSLTGLFRASGSILGALCKEQDRLNACFASTEEVMRNTGIQINELSGPDRFGPFQDIYEEYKEIKGSVSK